MRACWPGRRSHRRGSGCCARDAGSTGRVAGAGASGGLGSSRPRSASTACCFTGDTLQLASIRAVPEDFPLRQAGAHSPAAPRRLARSASPPGDAAARRHWGGTRGRQHPADGGRGAGPGAGSGSAPSMMAPAGADPQRRYRGDRGPAAGQSPAVALSRQGPRDGIARYEAWLNPRLSAGQKLVKPDDQGYPGKTPGTCRALLPSGIPGRRAARRAWPCG